MFSYSDALDHCAVFGLQEPVFHVPPPLGVEHGTPVEVEWMASFRSWHGLAGIGPRLGLTRILETAIHGAEP